MSRLNHSQLIVIIDLQYVKRMLFCRQILSVRLQQMMQAHCDEAIKLLNSSAATLSPGLSETQQVFQFNNC